MRNNGIQLRIGDMLFAIQKRWKLIVALTFVGLVFGLLLSGMTYVQGSLQNYEVKGSVAISTRPRSGFFINGTAQPTQNDYNLSEDMADAVIYIMRSDHVLSAVINELELLGVTETQIRSGLTVKQYNATQILEMTLTWHNADEGLAIWEGIIAKTNELLPVTLMMGSLNPINEAAVQRIGVGGVGGNVWVVMAVLGFAAGVGFAVMELLMHPTLTNVKDIETRFGLETLGVIPEDGAYFKRKSSLLVQDEVGSSAVTQNYAAAAYILRNRLGTREKHHCFYVTSANNREGRSTVAANLAIQLSDMEHRTLLVDLDSRNPTLGALFMNNVDYGHSLNALYRGDCNEQEAITTLTGYLDILPMVLEHNAIAMDGMVIDLIDRLSEKYEYVILDAPPVGKEADTLSLNQVASTVLYVVGYDKAAIPEIQAALDKLDKSGIRVLGCIVNGAQNGLNRNVQGQPAKKRKKKKAAPEEEVFVRRGKEAPIEGLTGSPAPKKEKSAKPKKTKKQKRGQAAPEPATVPPEQPAERPAASPARAKNVLEDLMWEEEPESARSDQDTMAELLKMGLDGSWGKEEPEAPSEAERPDGGT